MMGVGHAKSGLCAGLVVGNAMQFPPALTITLAIAGAGDALLSDIDCRGSTAESAFGPLSSIAHKVCVELHYITLAVVAPHYEVRHSAHRGLTHWWPWWIVTGGAVALGCVLSQWTAVGVLIVLGTLAVRGLTIPSQPSTPQSRFPYPVTHRAAMTAAYGLMQLTPLLFLRQARKHVTKTERLGGKRIGVTIPVGKLLVFLSVSAVVLGANYTGQLPDLGPWLGLLVWAGQFLHWLGDCPTEMGVPGFYLTRFWRLPKWLAFKAGGVFEVLALWIPMGLFAVYLILGTLNLRPHAEVVTVLWSVAAGFGMLATVISVLTIITRLVKGRTRV